MTDKREASLQERYACASSTSDLGLPHGDGAGAQGILAAAAWTEVHLGSALWRLAAAWEIAKPRKKEPRSRGQLIATGMTSKQATRQHAKEAISNKLTLEREKRVLKLRIPEYRQVWDALMVRAVRIGIEPADATALAVLDRWLENPKRAPESVEDAQLWQYMTECLNRARAALQQGVKGLTTSELARQAKHERDSGAAALTLPQTTKGTP